MAQQLYLEVGAIRHLGDVLQRLGPRRLLLVLEQASFDRSGAGIVLSKALQPYQVQRFSDFALNPKLADIERGLASLRGLEFDAVIAVGGGSVLDTAKLIRVLSTQDARPLEIVLGRVPIRNRGQPLIAIPTTAGTGSEATRFAVVYVGETKHSLDHEYVLPEVAIVDPELTYSMPPRITAATGMDAFSQAVESFWCVQATETSKAEAREAIGLVLNHIERAVHGGGVESRLAMSKAAHLAGRAINVSRTTAPHAVSYTMTSHFGVPHGHAASLTLGAFLVYNSQVSDKDVTDPRGAGYVRRTIDDLNRLLGQPDAAGSQERIRHLMHSIGLETRLCELGITSAADRERIVDGVNVERLANNPRRVTREGLRELLASVQGRPGV